MQGNDVELAFTPSILDTPDIVFTNTTTTTTTTTYDPLHNHTDNLSISNPSTTTTNETSSSTASSADVKVLRIEGELKQSFGESRKPTPSPFQKISSNSVFTYNKPPPVVTTEDGTTIEIPSTADVVKELEAMTNTNSSQFQVKDLINEINEREATLNGDNNRYDPSQITNKAQMVSPPKKNFLIRSQSHTEPTSPIQNNNQSQSQKTNHDNTQNGLDDENSMDNQFTRVSDVSSITHSNDFKPTINNGHDQNGISHTINKPIPVIANNNNNKRSFAMNMPPVTKASTIIIPTSSASLNEVSSTDQLSNIKRQRTAGSIPTNSNVMNFHSTYPSPNQTTTVINGGGTEEQRKKQIRDSNREAARRCRERRRQYIEQLEGNLEHHKLQIKQLTEKLTRTERENTQLRAILSETKILHTSRLSVNESNLDYSNVLNSDSNHQTDGGTIQRNYNNRNNL